MYDYFSLSISLYFYYYVRSLLHLIDTFENHSNQLSEDNNKRKRRDDEEEELKVLRNIIISYLSHSLSHFSSHFELIIDNFALEDIFEC